ncbi:MAG: fatty acid desaturase [Calditrichaceae bacterium]
MNTLSETSRNLTGLMIALGIILVWGGSLIFLLSLNINWSVFLWIPLVLWQTFFYTGLFITAHDAMHGSVFPPNRILNDTIGAVSVILFALFSYRKLKRKHSEHHRFPGTRKDPDFHDGHNRGIVRWYFHFLRGYIGWRQLAGMALIFNVLEHLLNVPVQNLIAFWIMPSLLSTVQLFYFGTYLPHRETEITFTDHHRARSNEYPVFWSFLTCFHFGYHLEHHLYPSSSWWRLPVVRKNFVRSFIDAK